MKFLSFFLVFVFLFSCTTNVQEKKNPIEGTWELVSGKMTWADSSISYPYSEYHRMIKIISKKHFVFINQDTTLEEYSDFGGGTYSLEGDIYTEHIEFFSSSDFIGKSFSFKSEVKGNQWTMSGSFPLKKMGLGEYDVDLYEVYKRLD
jgi:hypothetical protein